MGWRMAKMTNKSLLPTIQVRNEKKDKGAQQCSPFLLSRECPAASPSNAAITTSRLFATPPRELLHCMCASVTSMDSSKRISYSCVGFSPKGRNLNQIFCPIPYCKGMSLYTSNIAELSPEWFCF